MIQENRDNMKIITLEILSKAIVNRMGIDIEKARKNASFVLDIFGYADRVIDNVLNTEDRQLFYILEEEKMLATNQEDTILYDGRKWRTHYWVLKKNIILKYAKEESNIMRNVISDKPVRDISSVCIYDSLSDETWTKRKRCWL